jgi:hypothetical protein
MGRTIISYVRVEGATSTLVDVDNSVIQDNFNKIPVIYFTEQPTHKVRLLKADGTAYTLAELQSYTSWDFAIAEDFSGATVPPVRTQAGITVSEETWTKLDGTSVTGGVINIPVDANTTELQTILGTEPYIYIQPDSPEGRTITVGTELLGYIAPEADPSLIVQYPFVFRNRRITSATPPGTPGVDYLTPAQIAALYCEEAPVDGNIYARKDGAWTIASGSGDMVKSVYDPTNVNADAFNMDNMVEGANAKIMTTAERNKLNGIGTGANVVSCVSGTDITVDNTDPQNPVFNFTGSTSPSLTVKDGVTTVNNVDQITFSGATISDDGNGDTTVTITGGGGGEANTASNVGTAGVGIYDSKNGVDLRFKKLNSLTTALTINLDTPNQKIDFNFDESQINHINLANVGTNSHADIDSHIADSTIHYTQASINTDNITEGVTKLLMTTTERTKVGLVKSDQGVDNYLNGAGAYTDPLAPFSSSEVDKAVLGDGAGGWYNALYTQPRQFSAGDVGAVLGITSATSIGKVSVSGRGGIWTSESSYIVDVTLTGTEDDKLIVFGSTASADRTFTLKSSPNDKDIVWIASDNASYVLTVNDGTNNIAFLYENDIYKFVYSSTLGRWEMTGA